VTVRNLLPALSGAIFARVDDEFDEFPVDAGSSRRLNVLYLVAELEEAIKRGGVAWTAEDVALPDRVANLLSALRGQIEEG
jgi:hypothetical protein